ncbi:MAG: carboxylesterase family protein [Butyrivibrio sp.]|nr:carboxylesterase family protein [Butyrivibrio sp.]
MLRETTTENGKVRGLPGNDPRVTVFKGIPFAAPPIGENRWKAPQPCKDYEGTLNAFSFGPISYQDTPGVGDMLYNREWHVDPDIPMSEDCLYLNIWTPAKDKNEKLPVLVWIYGGAFQWGYTAEMEFNGEPLAKRGVIVVSIAYRLGCFGFLAHPEISSESPDAPANFGLLDQKAGLDWVKRNIASFGGDPCRITLGGQSAGGASVQHQLSCKDNKDIIKAAAIFSGIIKLKNDDADIFNPLNLSQAEDLGKEFLKALA